MIQLATISGERGYLRPREQERVRERILRLLHTEIDFIANKSFRVVDRVLEEEVLAGDHDHETPTTRPPKNLPGHLARLCEAGMLSPDEEQVLFRRMNYLKYRVNVLRTRLNADVPDRDLLERAERLLAAAMSVRDRIIKANMRLAISIVKKFVTPQHSFDDLLSDGIYSLMQAVDKFDFERGFRFSTYAYRAIARNAYRSITKRQKELLHFSNEMDDVSLEGTADRSASSMDVRTWSRLRTVLAHVMDRLDRREQLIIRCRYALGAHRKVKTFQAIADKLGVSKERVRQLEQRAMAKLRAMTAEMEIDELVEPAIS